MTASCHVVAELIINSCLKGTKGYQNNQTDIKINVQSKYVILHIQSDLISDLMTF